MNHNLALIVALAVPAVTLVVLRMNAGLVFLSLSLGAVLVQYVASEANTLIHLATPHASPLSTSSIQLFLLVVPAAVTMVVTIFSVHGRLRNVINVLPSLAASALFVLLAVPLLPPGLRYNLQGQQAWHYLSDAESLVVGVGALVSLLFLWSQRSFFKQHDKRRK
jgi:hypothetical protein